MCVCVCVTVCMFVTLREGEGERYPYSVSFMQFLTTEFDLKEREKVAEKLSYLFTVGCWLGFVCVCVGGRGVFLSGPRGDLVCCQNR